MRSNCGSIAGWRMPWNLDNYLWNGDSKWKEKCVKCQKKSSENAIPFLAFELVNSKHTVVLFHSMSTYGFYEPIPIKTEFGSEWDDPVMRRAAHSNQQRHARERDRERKMRLFRLYTLCFYCLFVIHFVYPFWNSCVCTRLSFVLFLQFYFSSSSSLFSNSGFA